ncbi:MAG: UDP-N-acetylglucosamine 1-carboxyvinyltransferase [Nitrospinaceae bacterium]|jgi:UDP-N-acetylglucosamine 1-carboxyvinyltransferase|nr:UDP-N-acetylglucosamine 1-carboxyvinyltransferase [Nitrospinaceae bacterium]MBT3821236.1 UDP-N-acetylglucosamine 1-carboxyvinyltransferase [Nitrospinaceae bacterium]MBT4093644.1 UDP-N-acetylglucosamine 1-carboxyvinyltransferase [Nitrospinaceae bacterium]MBT4429703.1 UDP-N-acetylglucosamine 1-carboxyvinyltransferase [Nitrospinaceae bacterium]MBT5367800.1 UDP-N-acetylglucosamine 1-carboxyvinyltransferase [Nitrospinaceae bacterium]
MDQFRIHGGKALRGGVEAAGSKNATLPILAASLLADSPCRLTRVPNLRDTETFLTLLGEFGLSVERPVPREVIIDTSGARTGVAPYDLVRTMRASVMVLGPLVTRFGEAQVSLPGGCAIGARPIDQHLKGLEAMGAEISLEEGYIDVKAKRLKGARISFDMVTVTGTKNLMMAAALAKGVTVLENAALEPEVSYLADLINQMGGRVSGAGTSIIEIEGVDRLGGYDVEVPPDRIEVGTFMIAGAITRGDVTIHRCVPEHVRSLTLKLRDAGLEVTEGNDWVRVLANGPIKPVNIKTAAYPGFPTDLQAQFMVLMTLAKGSCAITETIFENRFMHAAEIIRMGAKVVIDGRTAHLDGVEELAGAHVMATDLRASASLVLAGLAAKGDTIVRRVYHIDRGYERIEERLRTLGAEIERVSE